MTEIKDRQSIIQKYLINLSNYTVIKKIKSGSFGVVYHVRDKKTNQEYAAKVLTNGDDEINKTMINREIGIMMRIQHPTIIRFYGYSLKDFDNQDNVTFLMDIAKNGSLSSYLQNVKKGLGNLMYDNTTRQKILIGISYGMMHLHRNHIIHRDLKPGNILLDEQLNPHITDFGLSKFYHDDHSQSQTQSYGTSIYMAPEVIQGNRYNGKADVYSFAILMFEVLTDTDPYPDFQKGKMSLFQFNKLVVDEKLRPKFTVPVKESLQKLIIQCWSENPSIRPSFEEIFNKLAFNIDDSGFDIFDVDYNYYLDNVNVDEILDYAYGISEKVNEESSNNIVIEKLINENSLLKDEIKQLKIDQQKQQQVHKEDINQLKKEIELLKQLIQNDQNKKPPTKIELAPKESPTKTEKTKKEIPSKTEITKKEIPSKTEMTKKEIPSKIHHEILTFEYDGKNSFDGIVKYLSKITGGNIHDNSTIKVTSDSILDSMYHPKTLLNSIRIGNDYSSYQSNGKSLAWICFDFKKYLIKLTNYSIRSCHWSKNIGHIKSWVIEISNDYKNWKEIDKHDNCSDLNGPKLIKTYKVKPNEFSQYVRFRHTCETWDGGTFGFNAIEFYGSLKMP